MLSLNLIDLLFTLFPYVQPYFNIIMPQQNFKKYDAPTLQHSHAPHKNRTNTTNNSYIFKKPEHIMIHPMPQTIFDQYQYYNLTATSLFFVIAIHPTHHQKYKNLPEQ